MKKINDIAKALGASEVRDQTGRIIWKASMLRKEFDVEVMAWQIIDDKDFDTMVNILIELKAHRETTCEHCGEGLWDGRGAMHSVCAS